MSDPKDMGPRPARDEFRGTELLLRLSQRLTDWYTEPVTDEDITSALGADLLPVFRYAQARLDGRIRNVTLEPAFCHSADMAFRAIGVGYPPSVLAICLLHDVIEDSVDSITAIPQAAADLEQRFGVEVARTVYLLTNRYQIIFKGMVPKIRRDVTFDERTLRAFRAALDVARFELPLKVVEQFETELQRLATFLEAEATIVDGQRIVKRDKRYTVAIHLERQVYNLYVEEIVRQAAAAARGDEPPELGNALVVKLIDMIDNVRTSEVSNRLTLYKLTNKAESLLDRVAAGFVGGVPADLAEPTTIPALHRIVQLRLVDQLEARRHAVTDHFTETRFGGLVDFLGEQSRRLAAKYQVGEDRVERIQELEDQIRAANQHKSRLA